VTSNAATCGLGWIRESTLWQICGYFHEAVPSLLRCAWQVHAMYNVDISSCVGYRPEVREVGRQLSAGSHSLPSGSSSPSERKIGSNLSLGVGES
jgi:hypothetical protein